MAERIGVDMLRRLTLGKRHEIVQNRRYSSPSFHQHVPAKSWDVLLVQTVSGRIRLGSTALLTGKVYISARRRADGDLQHLERP